MSENTPTPGRTRRRVVRSADPPTDGPTPTTPARPEPTTEAPAARSTSDDDKTVRGATADADTVRLGSATAGHAGSPDADTVRLASTAHAGAADTVRTASVAEAAGAADAETVRTVSTGDAAHAGSADAETVRMGAQPAGETAAGESESASGKKRLGWLGWVAAVVAVLSALVLLGSGGFFVYHQRHADALDTRRADYAQTAKQAVLNLTNIKDDTAPQDIDRVLAVASGQLKAEYSERKDAYAQVVQQAKVKASGEIIETAIESEDDHSARVLIAAKQTLTNAASADPQQRYYRFRVTVARGDDGHLTASQVEFVA
ncbi:hypothetical protein [Nocardia blacklockiae]|uniref:hypothetical protein n=1 Tax=Nocardia blacklockiae TaxID=480036 RepID=UPI001893EE6D|nr:hypothetical protein [Nocardia blacklockiae]MBF6173063.1 hypothetical protein [Nocardia blacklockiae]